MWDAYGAVNGQYIDRVSCIGDFTKRIPLRFTISIQYLNSRHIIIDIDDDKLSEQFDLRAV